MRPCWSQKAAAVRPPLSRRWSASPRLSSSPCRRRTPRRCHGEDAGVVRVLRGRGQEHQTGVVPDRLRHPQPLHPRLLLAQPDPAEPAEQAGQLHGESGSEPEQPPVTVQEVLEVYLQAVLLPTSVQVV